MKQLRASQTGTLVIFLIALTAMTASMDAQGRASRPPNSIPIEPKSIASDCPSEPSGTYPADVSQPSDFVELERTSCEGACPVYKVKIRADGTLAGLVARQPIAATVSPADARALIDRLQSNGFWNLCGHYAMPATDGSTAITTLHVGDREKRITNYLNGAPRLLQQFEFEIDALADTHRWLHGDPRKELVENVRADGAMAKPGVTALMRAAIIADTVEIQQLLVAKSDPNAQDSSGWTALVYAAQGAKIGRVDAATYSSGIESIKMLLDVGADSNIRSFMDQTALMAAVTAYYSPVEKAKLLIAAGADVNAQDKNGYTSLMHIISGSLGRDNKYAEQVELCSLLITAGTRTDLTDSRGLTVFDILDNELQRWSAPSQPSRFVQSVRMQYQELLRVLSR